MSKAEILAELPKLRVEELAEVQAKLDELTGEVWLDDGELTDADKAALDAALADYQKNPDARQPVGGSRSSHPSRAAPVTRRLIIRVEAEADIAEAALWYQGQRPAGSMHCHRRRTCVRSSAFTRGSMVCCRRSNALSSPL